MINNKLKQRIFLSSSSIFLGRQVPQPTPGYAVPGTVDTFFAYFASASDSFCPHNTHAARTHGVNARAQPLVHTRPPRDRQEQNHAAI